MMDRSVSKTNTNSSELLNIVIRPKAENYTWKKEERKIKKERQRDGEKQREIEGRKGGEGNEKKIER